MLLLDTIKLYHAHGLVVTPLRDKKPFIKNWQQEEWQSTFSKERYKDVVSAGFVIPKNYLVIDVDNHDNQQGTASIKQMSVDYNYNFIKNAKVKVNTANGGLHLYYKLSNGDIQIPNSLAKYPSVEFKHTGRQVVIPESVLENGKKYSFHLLSSNNLSDLNFLPDNVLEDLVKQWVVTTPTTPQNKNQIKALDLEADVSHFQKIIQEQEVNIGNRNNQFYKLACMGRELALSPKKVSEILKAFNAEKVQPPLGINEVEHCVNSAFTYAKNKQASNSVSVFDDVDDIVETSPEQRAINDSEIDAWKEALVSDKHGAPSRTKFATHNTQIFLQNLPVFKGKLAVNLFSMDTIWKEPAPWHKTRGGEFDRVVDDDDIIRIRESLNSVGYDPAPTHILEACRAVSLRNEYHPVKEYFDGLPAWDRKERLKDFFADYCGAERSAYTEQIGIKIFTAIVARIYNPGCKFDYLPIIIGTQGLGKSTMLEAIAIKPQWYTDNLGSIDNKDVILRMRSKLIVENAELTMFDKTDPNQVKAFLSRRVDRDRLPYDRLPRDLPRQCIIFATTNKDRFLQDETGNRRMWPIEVKKIELDKIKANLGQLYAEAIVRYKNKEKLYLDDAEADLIAKQIQDDRYNSDDWEEFVMRYLDTEDKTTILKIWEECFMKDPTALGYREQARIGKILRRLGWVRQTIRIDNKPVSGYAKRSINLQ